MKDRVLNIALMLMLGLAGYALALYLDRHAPPPRAQMGAGKSAAPTVQMKVPEFSFTTLDGQTHNIADFHGKIIVLNFWASWCAPCQKEFPDLLHIAADKKEDVVLIALSSDIDQDAVDKFLRKINFAPSENVLIAIDRDQHITEGLFQTYRLPETWIINRHQILKSKLIGAAWNKKDLLSMIEARE